MHDPENESGPLARLSLDLRPVEPDGLRIYRDRRAFRMYDDEGRVAEVRLNGIDVEDPGRFARKLYQLLCAADRAGGR